MNANANAQQSSGAIQQRELTPGRNHHPIRERKLVIIAAAAALDWVVRSFQGDDVLGCGGAGGQEGVSSASCQSKGRARPAERRERRATGWMMRYEHTELGVGLRRSVVEESTKRPTRLQGTFAVRMIGD